MNADIRENKVPAVMEGMRGDDTVIPQILGSGLHHRTALNKMSYLSTSGKIIQVNRMKYKFSIILILRFNKFFKIP